jgi:hypothetical protein
MHIHTSLVMAVALVTAGPALADPPRAALQICADGLAMGKERAVAGDDRLRPALEELAKRAPGLAEPVGKLAQNACVPLEELVAALAAPPAAARVEVDQAALEARVLRDWQAEWQRQEATRSGLGAFLMLGRPERWMPVAPRTREGLHSALKVQAERAARPEPGVAAILELPVLASDSEEGLLEQTRRAAQRFAAGYDERHARQLTELDERAQSLDTESLRDTMELARLAGEVIGLADELERLAVLSERLTRERRPSPEQLKLEAALSERRTGTGHALLARLLALATHAGVARERVQSLAQLRAERRSLGSGIHRLLVYPQEAIPAAAVPVVTLLLTLPPGGDPVRKGLALVLVRSSEDKPLPPPARGGKPGKAKRSRLRLEEEGVERSSPDLRPADGRMPPPADAAAAARASDEQACEMGNAAACYQLGLACAHGSGGARDAAAARRALDKACDGSFALACYQLGVFLAGDDLGPADPERARAYLGRACRGGLQKACDKLGR